MAARGGPQAQTRKPQANNPPPTSQGRERHRQLFEKVRRTTMDQKDRELTEALNELNILAEDFFTLARDFHTLQEAVKDLLQANGIPPDAWGDNAKEPRWRLVQHSRLSKKIYELLKG